MNEDEARRVATLIARDLFTNGGGSRADRLVLVQDGKPQDLGGWSMQPVIDRITRTLISNAKESG